MERLTVRTAAGPAAFATSFRTAAGGAGDIAYVRGTGDLTFAWTDPDGQPREQRNRSVFLAIAVRQPDGAWKIRRRMWSDLLPAEG